MNGLREFVPGGFSLPWTPVFDGMGEFVGGGFPLPQNPVRAAATGSLPKAPPMPMALIGHGNGSSLEGIGCGCGGGCGCSGGMGALTSDTFIPQAKLPTFLQGDAYITGVPTLYLALGVVAAGFLFMGGSGGGRRRR